jgi:autoinducer 2-degrading protein
VIVRVIRVYVKPDSIPAFEEVTLENHRGSIGEPGVLRFDVLKSPEKPGDYLLYEVYSDEAATSAHKETAHYKRWRETVGPMMARDREGTAWDVVAPVDESQW